jgi:hypothetical protein
LREKYLDEKIIRFLGKEAEIRDFFDVVRCISRDNSNRMVPSSEADSHLLQIPGVIAALRRKKEEI